MALESKLGITEAAELAREEAHISKKRAPLLFGRVLLIQAYVSSGGFAGIEWKRELF